MSEVISIGQKKYNVKKNELELILNHPYPPLTLRKGLGEMYRSIGLINTIIEQTQIETFINFGVENGGFVSLYTNAKHNIIINDNDDRVGIYNFNINKQTHNPKVQLYDNLNKIPRLLAHPCVLRINNIKPSIKSEHNIVITQHEIPYPASHDRIKVGSEFVYYPKKYNLSHLDNYNNLINLCIMVKDAGDEFRKVLEHNLKYADCWTILDTGSTDNTINIINEIMPKSKGKLYQEPFINFRDSRNRLLDLAGQQCTFNIMLDDTYLLNGNVREFLEVMRNDTYSDSYSISIFDDTDHKSNPPNAKLSAKFHYNSGRITRSDRDLRYIYTMHEIVQSKNNITAKIPLDQMHIMDIRSDYMEKRTIGRKKYDLEVLTGLIEKQPNNPRHLYYMAETYKCMEDWQNAYNYFELRSKFKPTDGAQVSYYEDDDRIDFTQINYIDEVSDSLYEMALIAEHYLKKDWSIVHQLYLNAWYFDKRRIECLFCIGDYYRRNGIEDMSYIYFKLAFENINTTIQMSVRSNMYNYFLPHYLLHLCYKFTDYNLGIKCALHLLNNTVQPEDVVISWLNIFVRLYETENALKPLKYEHINVGKKLIFFVADGGYDSWDGSTLETHGLGGSETYVVSFAEEWVKLGYAVIVFCKDPKKNIHNGVEYYPLTKYIEIATKIEANYVIISRYSEYLPLTQKITKATTSIYFVIHDIFPIGNIIPIDNKLKNVLCISNWQRENFINSFPDLKSRTAVISNGIRPMDISNKEVKKYSFIYSSMANRGLIYLLRMFPEIKKLYPEATLDIFTDTKNQYVQSVSKAEMDEVDKLLEELSPMDVTNHGFVSKSVLNSYWLKAHIWFYPCKFPETFCISALEAAASKTLVITSDIAALPETVGDRGIIIKGDPSTKEWQDQAMGRIMDVFNNDNLALPYITANYEWSKTKTYAVLAKEFSETYLNTN